jgi:hypothetical protein
VFALSAEVAEAALKARVAALAAVAIARDACVSPDL